MTGIQKVFILVLLAATSGNLAACGTAVPVAAVPAMTAGQPTSDDAKPSATAVEPSAAAVAFAAAAVANADEAREIEWFFGGRTQRGWALYGDLIGHLVGTTAEPSSPEFASAVAAWQK